ncbi:hypothetical protein [Thermogutta sp.]|uniref:hypothetical protein n=1 Tax=Thermogutta sp. TaxID=1962930 RepID=UPI00321F9057
MSKANMQNLDIQCAELGRDLAEIRGIDEKVFNAALAVLEEQGPYAMFLYLNARHSGVAGDINKKSLEFLKRIFPEELDGLDGADGTLEGIKMLAKSLDNLLFARELLRIAFSYARYHLKAKGG